LATSSWTSSTRYLYFAVIQPRIGEGRIEDARAPRFANQLGAAFTTLAVVAPD
jgi:hypothetical protein